MGGSDVKMEDAGGGDDDDDEDMEEVS